MANECAQPTLQTCPQVREMQVDHKLPPRCDRISPYFVDGSVASTIRNDSLKGISSADRLSSI